ncbi:unnamed protein product [Rotaria socialis]|uniref:Spliceosome-associated protein CWC27 homolog n=1 Tax=Rotaria socialis TaxID=392032 RepID=A0A818R6X5_9BILA|nr:unnamed protein product [Rotaria socialis]
MSNIYIQEPATCGKVVLKTTVGDIEIQLFSKECPLACQNFVQLCMDGYYDGTIFHRVVPNSIAEGGDPTGSGEGGEFATSVFFPDEFDSRLCYNRRGLVGMVNQGPNTNAGQFFFTLGTTPELEKKNTLFGKVVGNTLFNMLKLGEGEIIGETPAHKHKIIKTEIISNPFDNMEPRPRSKPQIIDDNDEENKKSKQTVSAKAIKNYDLLSFEDEGEEEITKISVKFKEKETGKSAHDLTNDSTLNKNTVRLDKDNDEELSIKKQQSKPKEKTDEDFDKEELDRVGQRFNAKTLSKQEKRKSVVLDADDDDNNNNQQDISSSKSNENIKFEIERFKKVSKKSSIRVEPSEDTVKEEKESASHPIQQITTDTFIVMDESMAGTRRNNQKTDSNDSNSKESQIINVSPSKFSQPPSPLQPKTPKYNLRSKKMTDENIDHSIEKSNDMKINEGIIISVTDLINLLYALIKYKNIKPRQARFEDIQNQINEIDKIIEQYLFKLPSLTNDVFISYVITGVAYRIVASNPCCSCQSVNDFVRVSSHGFTPVDTFREASINFFKLLQSILSTSFVIQLYCELINYEENVSQETIEQSLKDNVSKLQMHMYLANLPDYYCALTLYDGKLLLNSSESGLFKSTDKMIRWDWELDSADDSMIEGWAALLIVIIHEIAHGLRRTIIPKARNLILAQRPPKSIVDSQREAGFCLETLLFGRKVESIGLPDGEYLLNAANWTVANVESFQKKLVEVATKDEEQNGKTRLKLPCRCVQEPTIGARIRIGACATSQYAIHLNN